MDLVFIELILWVGLIFFFWVLKDGLGNIESDMESLGLIQQDRLRAGGRPPFRFYRPERVAEPIGRYGDAAIFRYALIQGKTYQFDRVCPAGTEMKVDDDERCVPPGLVYQECTPEAPPFELNR